MLTGSIRKVALFDIVMAIFESVKRTSNHMKEDILPGKRKPFQYIPLTHMGQVVWPVLGLAKSV